MKSPMGIIAFAVMIAGGLLACWGGQKAGHLWNESEEVRRGSAEIGPADPVKADALQKQAESQQMVLLAGLGLTLVGCVLTVVAYRRAANWAAQYGNEFPPNTAPWAEWAHRAGGGYNAA